MEELAVPDHADRQTPRRTKSASTAPCSEPSTPSAESEDVFTHMWDDFSHWEKMVSDDKDHVEDRRPASCSSMSDMSIMAFSNQPDLIPVMPSMPAVPSMPSSAAGAGVWRHKGVEHAARRHSVAGDGDGFEERKRWFEQALLSWHAQDDEEHFGTSLYTPSLQQRQPPLEAIGGGRGLRADIGHGHAAPWHHAAWSAWTAPATSTY